MKKILALMLAVAMLFSFAACGDNTEEETTTTVAEEITEAPVEETTEAPAEDATEAPVEGDDELGIETTTVEESTVPAVAPATTEEIVAYYNDAVNKA